MSLNIVNHDNETINFDMEDVDTSFVNALRRLVLSDYETIGFNTDEYLNSDLKIIDNTSSLHNEFILHRFGLVPINIEDVNTFYNSKYTFSLQKENTTTEMISVTTEDFKVINTETNEEEPSINFFPPNKNTGEYILLLKLKSNPNNKGEKINIEGKASRSSGNKNARYSPVSCIYYRNVQDPDKIESGYKNYLSYNKIEPSDEIRKRFLLEEGERHFYTDDNGEPNRFHFYIESVGVMKPHLILKGVLTILKQKLLRFKNNVTKIITEGITMDDVEISESLDTMKAYSIIINNETHTLGNLLQFYISKLHDDNIKFVGYKNPHPLKNLIEIKLAPNEHTLTELNIIISETCDHLINIIDNFKTDVDTQLNIKTDLVIKKKRSKKKPLE